jgi:hypothetical protein
MDFAGWSVTGFGFQHPNVPVIPMGITGTLLIICPLT